jgi:hypothetical protein
VNVDFRLIRNVALSLCIPWSSRCRGSSSAIRRIHVAVVRRRAQNTATPPINGEMDRRQTAETVSHLTESFHEYFGKDKSKRGDNSNFTCF